MRETTDRTFDVILLGATGYTGRLVAEYLGERYGQVRAVDTVISVNIQDSLGMCLPASCPPAWPPTSMSS